LSAIEAQSAVSYGEQRTAITKLVDELVLERVKAGIALLEHEYGPAWVDKIDLKELDLVEGDVCVLGQVYADADIRPYLGEGESEDDFENGYTKGCRILDIERTDALYGFLDDNEAAITFRALQRTWEQVLTPMVTKR
jgi:hypothetical protein